MIVIKKIDFQGDDLFIHYNSDKDNMSSIRNRVIVVGWKDNKELNDTLKKMFENIIKRYMVNEEEVNWEKFSKEFREYEKRQNNE